MPTVWKSKARRNRSILLACCALFGFGCAQDRPIGLRARAGQSGDTIARDRRTIPRGQTIPPSGLGVDLVQSNQADAGDRENDVTQTSFSHLGVPDTIRR